MKQRLITGIFIVLATALAIVAKLLPYSIGDYIFDIFALIIAIIAGFEMCNIMEKMGKKVNKMLATMYSIFNYIVLIICMEFINFEWLILIEVASLLVYYLIVLCFEKFSNNKQTIKENATTSTNTVLACLYPSFMFCTILLINHIDDFAATKGFSMLILILVFAITYFTDTFAYLVGRTFKGPKLAPKVSPNKTISGAIGGLLGGIGAALLVYFVGKNIIDISFLSWWHFLIIGILGSAIGQSGDLFESFLKRKAGIKDSGNLFPGHGGMLDRYDALTFVTTFVYLFIFVVLIV